MAIEKYMTVVIKMPEDELQQKELISSLAVGSCLFGGEIVSGVTGDEISFAGRLENLVDPSVVKVARSQPRSPYIPSMQRKSPG